MLRIGIVGLPNVGKSTLFNALTKKSVPAENFPFCTIDPSHGIVAVPDRRLEQLSKFSQSKKTIPAGIEFVDIAGLVKGASDGEGLGNKFLAHIREVDAIAHVVRIFSDTGITHVHGEVDPVSDIEVITTELILADHDSLARHKEKVEKEARLGDKRTKEELILLERALSRLSGGQSLSSELFSKKEQEIVKHWHLLTTKPLLYVLNTRAGGHNLDELQDERWERLQSYLKESNAHFVIVDAGVEQELSDLSEDDRQGFREELGSLDDGVSALIQSGYALLSLISFFTTGPEETRAWTVPYGATAPQAGARIHSDFEEKFIRADVIDWKKLLTVDSYSKARQEGLIRTEGKEYIVEDGDVIEFKV